MTICFFHNFASGQPLQIAWQQASSGNDGEIEFTILTIPNLPGLDSREQYNVFWDFGDGTFTTDTLDQNQLSNNRMIHTYYQDPNVPDTFYVRAELTPVYSPPDNSDIRYASTEEHPSGSIVTANIFPLASGAPPQRNLHGKLYRADRSRNPKVGAGMNYMVTYYLDSLGQCDLAEKGGVMNVFYSSGLVLDKDYLDATSPRRVEVYHDESVTIDQSGFADWVYVRIPGDQASRGEQREVIFNFHTPQEIENPFADITVFIRDSAGFDCGTENRDELAILKKEDPYDPNFKVVSKDILLSDDAQTLTYVIQFQNTGKDTTDSITVVDILDPRLDPGSFVMGEVVMAYERESMEGIPSTPDPQFPRDPFSFEYDVSVVGNRVEWKITNTAKLRGTGEPGFRVEFVEKETIGQISYQIKTRYFEETNVVVSNFADVYFDSLPPIRTDTANTYKFCCCCEERTVNDSVTIDLTQYVDSSWTSPIDSIYKVALTTDTIGNANQRPSLNIDPNGIALYVADASFNGLDLLEFAVCTAGANNTLVCDTFQVPICVDVPASLFVCPADSATVGIEKDPRDLPSYFSIGPNPFLQYLNIYPVSSQLPIRKIELYTLQGIKILGQELESRELIQVSTSHIPPGMYLLRINQETTYKVIKQ